MHRSTSSSSTTRSRLDATAPLTIQAIIGPDCSPPLAVTPGRHTVGRAPSASLRFDDPSLELHHGVLDVDQDGSATLTQLSGRRPILVGMRAMTGPTPLAAGDTVHMGATQLLIERAHPPTLPSDPAATASLPVPLPIRLPEPVAVRAWPRTTVLTVAGASLAVAAAMWSIGWLVPAAVLAWGSVLVSAAWTAAVLVTARRRHGDRRVGIAATEEFTRQITVAREQARQAHRHRHPSLGEVLDRHQADRQTADGRSQQSVDVWVTLGIGDHRWSPTIESTARSDGDGDGDGDPVKDSPLTHIVDAVGSLHQVAIPWQLRPGSTIGLVGPRHLCLAVVRGVIVQIALDRGDAEWHFTVETSRCDDWRWAHDFVHARIGDVPSSLAPDATHLVVLDDPMTHPTIPWAEGHRAGNPTRSESVTTISLTRGSPLATGAHATLDIGATARARWSGEFGGEPFLLTGLGVERAGGLAGWRDASTSNGGTTRR